MDNIIRKYFGKQSQISMEILLLLGIIVIIVMSITYYTLQPREELTIIRAQDTVDSIGDYANKVAEMPPGSKLKIKVSVPTEVKGFTYDLNNIFADVSAFNGVTQVNKILKTNLSGYRFMKNGYIQTGFKDLILEAFPLGVCIYPPEERSTYCHCFQDFNVSNQPVIQPISTPSGTPANILCDFNGLAAQSCSDLKYNFNLTGLRVKCTGSEGNSVIYSIHNWKGEEVFTGRVLIGKDYYFNLTNIKYTVRNSDYLNISAICYDECYYYHPENSSYYAEVLERPFIPYGTIIPFIVTISGQKIFHSPVEPDEEYLQPVANDGSVRPVGQVRPNSRFILKTGYECHDGECIGVNAGLWHQGYNYP